VSSGLALSIVLALTIGIGACAPFVDVVDVKSVPQTTRESAMRIPIYSLGMAAPASFRALGAIEATSCKFLLSDPPATTGNALQQLQLKALQMGANGIVDVTFDTRGTDAFGTGCWQSVTATGIAVVMPVMPTPSAGAATGLEPASSPPIR
jgi:Putative heavy-metal-binding